MIYPRYIKKSLYASLADTPVVLLNGARQVGKTTVVRQLVEEGWGTDGPPLYTTLDDPLTRSRALSDPDGFLASYPGPLVIDEVQTAPDLLRAIKHSVDNDRRAGRFLLTGSADILALPTVSESLTGRIDIRTLLPLAQAEVEQRSLSLIDQLFSDEPMNMIASKEDRGLTARVLAGGYPESIFRTNQQRREDWFAAYTTTLIQRDIRDIASLERISDLPRLLRLIAVRTGSLVNYAEFSRSLAIPESTLKRYIDLLEATFLVHRLPPWATNLSKRLVRAPKIYLTDSGLAAALTGSGSAQIEGAGRGSLIETFVLMEVMKHAGWATHSASIYHFRTHAGQEVDIVLEDRRGTLVAIEIKAARTLTERDFRGLRFLEQETPDRFHRGILFYGGEEVRHYSSTITALPISWLWQSSGSRDDTIN